MPSRIRYHKILVIRMHYAPSTASKTSQRLSLLCRVQEAGSRWGAERGMSAGRLPCPVAHGDPAAPSPWVLTVAHMEVAL